MPRYLPARRNEGTRPKKEGLASDMQAFIIRTSFGSDDTTSPPFLQSQAFDVCTHASVYLYAVTALFIVLFPRSNNAIVVILYVDWWMNFSPSQCVIEMLRARFYTPSDFTLGSAIQPDSISGMRRFLVVLECGFLIVTYSKILDDYAPWHNWEARWSGVSCAYT